MKVNLYDLKRVWGGSGVQNFFGGKNPWWYHKYIKLIGGFFFKTTFVAKTTTLPPRLDPANKQGNMPMKEDGITPAELFPKCIHVTVPMWIYGIVLNAVGLSGPGAKALFERYEWQTREEPFVISFMSVALTKAERLEELRAFIDLLRAFLPDFICKLIVLQMNYSCPNVGHRLDELAEEVAEGLEIASVLDIALMPKFNVEMPVEKALALSRHPHCAGICISNTLPFGSKLLPESWWIKHFGTADPKQSPLAEFGGGGLSGYPLLKLVCRWIREFRKAGGTCYLNGGGGILGPIGIIRTLWAGADSVFIGSMLMLRPFFVALSILTAHVYCFFLRFFRDHLLENQTVKERFDY